MLPGAPAIDVKKPLLTALNSSVASLGDKQAAPRPSPGQRHPTLLLELVGW